MMWMWLYLPSLLLALGTATTAIPSWLESRLESFNLKAHDFPTTGRGLQTTSNRSPGDVVIKVTKGDALTATSLLDRYPDVLGRAAKAKEHEIKLTDEQIMAAGLLLLRDGGDKYVTSLPKEQYSVLDMPNSLLACLPRAYQQLIVAYREHCSGLCETLNQVLMSPISQGDFRWGFATVRSRCVGMDGKDDDRIRTGGTDEVRVMLPGFDLLNHKFGAQAISGYSEEDSMYVVTSDDPYTFGDQIFISYSDKRDSLKMLMTYGFCIPQNPEGVVFFDVIDLLQACATARPAYFSNQVLDQLLELMRKLGKVRDLFVFDGIARQPRDCLTKGMAMMAEIEKQFISDSDLQFASDVLNALMANRRDEVMQGLDRMKELETASTKASEGREWVPMIRSIVVLLQEEDGYLSRECSVEDSY